MTTSLILLGAGSGALHAIVAPDHLLSLGPAALQDPKSSLRVGGMWGVGHGFGTLALGLPLVLMASVVELPWLSTVTGRLAGLVLLLTAWGSWRMLRRPADPHGSASKGGPFWVGLLHGLTGASALVLMLPVVTSGHRLSALSYLLAFAVGSALGMAALTHAIGRVAGQLKATVMLRAQQFMITAAAILGGMWLVAG
ncbi:MAG TPA: hypothetical protein VK013_02090 [Myxococcaceae bacterium]|nr:hypothetical protein [Myxococcaceae bacterium]